MSPERIPASPRIAHPQDVERGRGVSSHRQFLYPAGTTEQSRDVSRWWNMGMLAVDTAWRELKRGSGRDWENIIKGIVTDWTRDHINPFQHISDGLETHFHLNIGDRGANALKRRQERDFYDPTKPSRFGTFMKDANNDPCDSDHNMPHTRRVERLVEAMILNVYELRHGECLNQLLAPIYLAVDKHDSGQVLQLARGRANQREGRGIIPNAKKAHGFEASAMLLVDAPLYESENILQPRHKNIADTDIAAYYMLGHDLPELFRKNVKIRARAVDDHKRPLMGRALVDATGTLKDREWKVDAASLTRGQVIEAMYQHKARHGQLEFGGLSRLLTDRRTRDSIVGLMHQYGLLAEGEVFESFDKLNQAAIADRVSASRMMAFRKAVLSRERQFGHRVDWDHVSVLGFIPQFEQEREMRISRVIHDRTPLDTSFADYDRGRVDLGKELFIIADFADMFIPPDPAIFRTLLTQYSTKRPFFPVMDDRSMREYINSLLPGESRIAEDVTGPDLLGEVIRHAPGNIPDLAYDSDTRRILMEFLHIKNVPSSDVMRTAPYVRQLNKENAIMGAYRFREIGTAIMRGDWEFIDEHYRERVRVLSVKALDQAGCSEWQIRGYARTPESVNSGEVAELIALRGDAGLSRRYAAMVDALGEEAQRLKFCLAKPEIPEDSQPVYTDAHVEMFQRVCDGVLAELRREYDVSDQEYKRLVKRASKGLFGESTPYRSYDSIGDPNRYKSIRELPPLDNNHGSAVQ